MKTIFTSKTRVVTLLLAIMMVIGLAACGADTANLDNGNIDPGSTITAPSPEGIPRGNGGKTTSGIPRGNGGKTTNTSEKILKKYGEITTLVKSVKTSSKVTDKTTKMDNKYGTVDWSTCNQGYITFTPKGQTREFILEGPNGVQSLFTSAKGTTIKIALVDGAGKYQYAIANNVDNGASYLVQYKNSFTVKTIDSDLAPFLVSTPWGDYANAPEATKKAKELWSSKKTQLDNIEAIAKWVSSNIKYNHDLKQGGADFYVNPDSIIKNGGGVCNEFSKLLVAMLRSQGVPAYYRIGSAPYDDKGEDGTHAWVLAWVELETSTKNGITSSKGAWISIEATSGEILRTSEVKDHYSDMTINYAG